MAVIGLLEMKIPIFISIIITWMPQKNLMSSLSLAQDIERFSKSGILIYNSEVPEMAGRKMRRVTQTIAKRYPLSVI